MLHCVIFRRLFFVYTELYKGGGIEDAVTAATKRSAGPIQAGVFLFFTYGWFDWLQSQCSRVFRSLQLTSLKVWPLVQVINFYAVPLKLRVLYMNVTLGGFPLFAIVCLFVVFGCFVCNPPGCFKQALMCCAYVRPQQLPLSV